MLDMLSQATACQVCYLHAIICKKAKKCGTFHTFSAEICTINLCMMYVIEQLIHRTSLSSASFCLNISVCNNPTLDSADYSVVVTG